MKPSSEYQSLYQHHQGTSVDSLVAYKACVAVANHGLTLPDEEVLAPIYRELISVRRLIFSKALAEAEEKLRSLQTDDGFLQGDIDFLLGQIYHKRGDQPTAAFLMQSAARHYGASGDSHRELRARVNGAICVSTLASTLFGDLYSCEQEARRQNYFDIVGNICRVRATELLVAGRLQETLAQALEAAHFYQLDGYQDDHSVAIFIGAIALMLQGDVARAQELRGQALATEGKSEIYKQAYDQLLCGKLPKTHEGHPLNAVNWKKLMVKAESVPGKIIARLRRGPCAKNELIDSVWGQDALSDSYRSRLHTAINYLRQEKSISVVFDGEFYSLG
jgi:tetratricopeptide (TPR) repeat protein